MFLINMYLESTILRWLFLFDSFFLVSASRSSLLIFLPFEQTTKCDISTIVANAANAQRLYSAHRFRGARSSRTAPERRKLFVVVPPARTVKKALSGSLTLWEPVSVWVDFLAARRRRRQEESGGEREPSNEGRKDGMNELGLARDLFLLECVLVCVGRLLVVGVIIVFFLLLFLCRLGGCEIGDC